MNAKISRRGFVKSSLLASAAIPLTLGASTERARAAVPASGEAMPMGKIGNMEFSRLMLGGNLIGGYAHARDLAYVSTLMRRYNTPAKIRETLEIAEAQGINVINTWVMQENGAIFEHWKNGGKIKWIAQARLDGSGGFSQVQKAVDEGACGVHLTGDTCEGLLDQGKFEIVPASLEFIRSRKVLSGVAAHDLRVIVECEKLRLSPDFYQKTFHSLDYYTAPRQDDKGAVGNHDNSWCNDPQAVVDVMSKVSKPWIAFKILAAGAIPPRAAFPYAFNSGADFILVGMFDWQVVDNAQLARRVCRVIKGSESKRTRPWLG